MSSGSKATFSNQETTSLVMEQTTTQAQTQTKTEEGKMKKSLIFQLLLNIYT